MTHKQELQNNEKSTFPKVQVPGFFSHAKHNADIVDSGYFYCHYSGGWLNKRLQLISTLVVSLGTSARPRVMLIVPEIDNEKPFIGIRPP